MLGTDIRATIHSYKGDFKYYCNAYAVELNS